MNTTAVDPLVGTLLDGRYRVGRPIARGGMATVYQATDQRLDRELAVKVLHPGYAADPDFVTRFRREARAAARLSHPNVVNVFDQGSHNGTLFLAMEYVPGRTLRQLMRDQAPIPPGRALALLEPVLSALAAAHQAGIVHRDVKPENVLITDDGRVKVADFGLARAVTTSTSTTATSGVLMGTVSYLAPELVVHNVADARTDIYAVGVLLYEMLTGEKPHRGDLPVQVAFKHVHEDVPAPSEQQQGVPPYVDALVARAAARDHDARFADAKVMLHQVRRVRHALDNGVWDDPDLTADLQPRPPGEATEELENDFADLSLGAPPEYGVEHTVAVPARRPADGDGPAGDEAWAAPETTVPPATTPEGSDGGPGRPPGQPAGPAKRQRRSRRRGAIGLILVLLLATAAAVGGWYFGVGRYTSTPDLVGDTVRQARGELVGTDLGLSSTKAFSETVAEGHIISTDPAPGDRVLKDGEISAVVSKGKERYDLPPLRGQTEQDAVAALENNHLAVGDITREWSEDVAKGSVISTSEAAGTPLRRDTEVDLVVSKGREPIDVPDLTGKPAANAKKRLDDLGLKAKTSEAYDNEVPKGAVISQSPQDGTLFRGQQVKLVVSLGPELVEVPSVFYQTEDEARQTLADAGFEIEVRQADTYIGFNRVGAQDPGSGDEAPRGSTVTVYLY